MIVDTGSVVSLISKNLFDKINSENLLLVEPMQDNLRGVTNDAINIIGAVNISVRLVGGSNCILSNEFLIADGIAPECLLGLNFLNKYNAKIDMTNKKLIINSYDQTFKHNLVNKPYNDMPVPVYLVYKQTVKAFTQMFVIVRFSADDCDIDDDWNSVEEVIYAPNVHIADKYNLLVANCVVPIRGNTMYVHVANMTNNDVEIYPGTPFGTAEPYDEHEYESINSVNEYDESINSKTHVLYRDEIDTDEEEKRNKINDRLIKCRNGYHDGWYESDEENFYGSDIERVLKLPLKTSEWIKYSGLDCDMSKMNYEEKQDVLQLIAKYRQAFAQHEHDYGRTDIIKHKIELKSGTSPVRMAPYRMSPPQREIVEKHIDDMLRDGIIQESSGEFSSPIVLVKKKDGSIRFSGWGACEPLLLGPARICPRGQEGMLFELGRPPDCNIRKNSIPIQQVYIKPYFRKTLSSNFKVFSCSIQTDKTTTFQSFFGSKGITGHSTTFRAIDEESCRILANTIKSGKLNHGLIQVGPYLYVNSTKQDINYKWCCYDYEQRFVKVVIQQLFAAYNYHSHQLFSASVKISGCDPTKLSCIVDDQMLVWDENSFSICELISGPVIQAEQKGNELLAKQSQLALTLTGNKIRVCNMEVYET
jgi:hypothetical protein